MQTTSATGLRSPIFNEKRMAHSRTLSLLLFPDKTYWRRSPFFTLSSHSSLLGHYFLVQSFFLIPRKITIMPEKGKTPPIFPAGILELYHIVVSLIRGEAHVFFPEHGTFHYDEGVFYQVQLPVLFQIKRRKGMAGAAAKPRMVCVGESGVVVQPCFGVVIPCGGGFPPEIVLSAPPKFPVLCPESEPLL
jgi:hypothetical protein